MKNVKDKFACSVIKKKHRYSFDCEIFSDVLRYSLGIAQPYLMKRKCICRKCKCGIKCWYLPRRQAQLMEKRIGNIDKTLYIQNVYSERKKL